ncbi:MAG: 1-deoxy-D-xylulose-5-phosphate reductoisomerase [Phycisphaera sp.]|nr:1-deoxy-D-xylulose-5-phosphate reductoisomerase [Phycisphaera sp.]
MSGDANRPGRRRLIVLGCTGSIGVNTLRVAENLGDAYEVVGLAAGSNADVLVEQATKFGVDRVAIANADLAASVRNRLPNATVYAGPDAAEQLVRDTDAETIVAAIVGAAGLPATIAAIEKGMDVALANKETLIAAGELVIPLVKKHGVHLLPVDSEHSAIFQCIQGNGQGSNGSLRGIKRIVLTASGGPFRNATREQIESATVEKALNHPTWNMGPKITIDSATMMNKALEIIEAHWLFGLTGEQIGVIIHPQSIAHSFVEFTDHSVLAQLGPPDMKTPIQYALTWPERAPGCSAEMDWTKLSTLVFEQPDFERFPSLRHAYRVIDLGGTAGAIFNAANEAAVAAFLDRRIPFGRITTLAASALDAIDVQPVRDLDTVLAADRAARAFVAAEITSG